ncbi:hypothetical protein AMTRI_Chr01g130480 [Amborella trichopoda]
MGQKLLTRPILQTNPPIHRVTILASFYILAFRHFYGLGFRFQSPNVTLPFLGFRFSFSVSKCDPVVRCRRAPCFIFPSLSHRSGHKFLFRSLSLFFFIVFITS